MMVVSDLKELRNYILGIIHAWSLFCLVRVYMSLHSLPILSVKLGFCLSVLWFFVFPDLWFLVFRFLVYVFNSMSSQNT